MEDVVSFGDKAIKETNAQIAPKSTKPKVY